MVYGNLNQPKRSNPTVIRRKIKIAVVVDTGLSEQHQTPRPRRRRHIDYAKKIMNDDFIMNL
jgi:hypothetical protein